jgi:thiamine biosynthesis lipoprotein
MKRFQPYFFVLLSALLVLALSSGCKKQGAATYPSETRDLFGTKITVTIYDQLLKPAAAKAYFDEAFKFMAYWEGALVKPGPQNQVAMISKDAGTQSVPIEADVFTFLMKAMRVFDYGAQTYDIRYGPMLDAWNFGKSPRVPAKAEIDTLKGLVAEGGMFVAGSSILLAKPGMRFDVSEMAIGQALDAAATKLTELGVRSATLHSPYVWRGIGEAPDPTGFTVEFPDPANSQIAWAKVHVPAGAVAMKSASMGRFEAAGTTYHRLLDPRTGMPATRCAAAAVAASDAATAEAMAYSLFVTASVDSFSTDGKASIGGSLVLKSEGGKITHQNWGVLQKRFELAAK